MSRSFHVTRKNFRNCSKAELQEMIDDEFSEFTEWSKKMHIKKITLEKRNFEKVYSQLIKDESLSDEVISEYDDRDYFYEALRTRYFQRTKNEEALPLTLGKYE